MDEDRPSNDADTMVTPPQDESTNDENGGAKRPSGFLIAGFLIVLTLVIAGLFLPPISLGQRLGFGGEDGETAVDSATQTPELGQTEIPGEMSLSTANQDANVGVNTVATTDIASVSIGTLPANFAWQGNVYTVEHDQTALSGQIALTPQDGANAKQLDLYGWNGGEWQFVPSQIDTANQQLVSFEHNLYSAYALGQRNSSAAMSVGVELLPDQTLPDAVLPSITEVSAGTLTLVGNGDLQGGATAVPAGTYQRFLRATNVGAVVDQASLSAFLNDSTAQSNQVNALVNTAVSGGFAGVNLDYQTISASQAQAFTGFVTLLSDALHAQNLDLAVTLGVPQETGGNWDTAGQDWRALGQLADIVYMQMPIDPTAYGVDGTAEQLLTWATHQIDRTKLVTLVDAGAVDRIGEIYTPLSNEAALANFGELQFVHGAEEVEPNTAIEVVLSGNATPLEWDGTSLTYKYSYEKDGQTHNVWLGNPAALSQRLGLASTFNLRGISVRSLGNAQDSDEYADALSSAVGVGTPPETTGAAIVWTVTDENDSVLASESGSNLAFTWDGASNGSYTVNADFALGDSIATLGSLPVAIIVDEPVEVVEEEEDDETAATEAEAPVEATPEPTTPPTTFDPGDADAVTNTNANVRVGPGLSFGNLAGGAPAGTQVQLLGRNSDSSWLKVLMPDSQEGWIFATLLTVNDGVSVASLEVVEVEAPPVGSNPPPPVAPPPPATGNANFELGGQAFGAPYGMMSYSGMNWIKRQHKWSPGQSGTDLAGTISEAHNGGFKILLSIPGANLYPSSIDFNAYAAFLGQVAALPDPPDAIEIWNEMNIDREWPIGSINPSDYVNLMLKPAYNAIKNANGNVMVVSGAPAPTGFFGGCGGNGCDDAPYMAAVAAAGGGSYMDCIGIHYNEGIISPNQTSGDPRSEHYTRYFWGMVDAYYNAFGGSRPLCFTEIGYLTPEGFGSLPGGFAWAQNVTVAQQAQWLAEAASLSAGSGKVRLMIVWNIDSTTWNDDPQAGFAIIRPGGGCAACESLRQVMGQ
ncbi:MAG: SH3 domain-containing protein [Chloroflexi bacterium]|nr:SH3 domain-containing protein [Chloroflexota bacterium]